MVPNPVEGLSPKAKRSGDYNVTQIYLDLHEKIHEAQEATISKRIETLDQLNAQNGLLHELLCALTLASKNKDPNDKSKTNEADFTNDHKMREIIEEILTFAPEIFGNCDMQKGEHLVWKTEDEVQSALKRIDERVRLQVSEVSRVTMFISKDYEDRIQYTESALKTLEMMIRHIDSIISKYRK
jgi:hypothetical protein